MSALATLVRMLKGIPSTFSKAAVLVSLKDLALVRVTPHCYVRPVCHITPASAGVRNQPAAGESLLHLAHQILPCFYYRVI